MSFVTSGPTETTLNLGNGFSSTTSYKYDSNGMPTSIVTNNYQNGVLTETNNEYFSYNNGSETVNWNNYNKTYNTTSSGSYTINY